MVLGSSGATRVQHALPTRDLCPIRHPGQAIQSTAQTSQAITTLSGSPTTATSSNARLMIATCSSRAYLDHRLGSEGVRGRIRMHPKVLELSHLPSSNLLDVIICLRCIIVLQFLSLPMTKILQASKLDPPHSIECRAWRAGWPNRHLGVWRVGPRSKPSISNGCVRVTWSPSVPFDGVAR